MKHKADVDVDADVERIHLSYFFVGSRKLQCVKPGLDSFTI